MGYKVAKIEPPMRRRRVGGGGMRHSGSSGTMQFNVWDDPTQ